MKVNFWASTRGLNCKEQVEANPQKEIGSSFVYRKSMLKLKAKSWAKDLSLNWKLENKVEMQWSMDGKTSLSRRWWRQMWG